MSVGYLDAVEAAAVVASGGCDDVAVVSVRERELEAEVALLKQQVADVAEAKRVSDVGLSELQAWVRQVNDAAIEWADDNNLCEEFDFFCEQHGLESRRVDYVLTVDARVEVTIRLDERRRGLSTHDLQAEIDTADVRDAINQRFSVSDYDVIDFEEDR